MKTISVVVNIRSGSGSPEAMRYEKSGPAAEIEVLASAIGTIFIKSKEARRLAERRNHPVLELGAKRKKHGKK